MTPARLALLLAIIGGLAWFSWLRHDRLLGVDDAQIAFVYAANLTDGYGFVYNQGGERVEGFTSMLSVVTAAPWFLGSSSPEPTLLILSIAFTAVACWIGGGLVTVSLPAWLLYVTVVLASPAYVTWQTVSLMDTALWGLLLISAVALTLRVEASTRGSVALGSVLSAVILARPESLLIVPVFLALRSGRLAAVGHPRVLRAVALPAIMAATTLAVLTFFRLLYFGYPLPNTYYAKVSPSIRYSLARGLEYLESFAAGTPVAVALCGLTAIVLAFAVGRIVRASGGAADVLRSDAVVLAILSATLLVVPVLNGGDHFPWWRMYQPALPIFAALPFAMAREWPGGLPISVSVKPISWAAPCLAAAVIAAGYGHSSWLSDERPLLQEFRIARDGAMGGRLLARLFDGFPLPSVGVVTAGGVKRTYNGTVIDLMGLNDTRMAHAPGDRIGVKNHAAFNPQVFFEHSPDMLWAFPRAPLSESPAERDALAAFAHRVLRRLPSDPTFIARYRPARVCRVDALSVCVTAYYRADFLEQLRRAGAYQVTEEPGA